MSHYAGGLRVLEGEKNCLSDPRDDALRDNRYVYEMLLDWFSKRGSELPEQRVCNAEVVAAFAYKNHPGLFSDGRLENSLLGLPVRDVTIQYRVFAQRKDGLRVLHVATRVAAVGGHSRVVDGWIRCDRASNHALVLTDQSCPVPDWLLATCDASGASVFHLDRKEGRLARAAQLRAMSRQADVVVLHQHPDDAIPVCALSTCSPPVIFWNHAHYWFSLGPSIADVTVNSQRYFSEQSRRFRNAGNACVLPVTGVPFRFRDNRRNDRVFLGLDQHSSILLSMGNPAYFCPSQGKNFFECVDRVLDKHNNTVLMLVGPGPDCADVRCMRNRSRVRACGLVSDPTPYYGAADIVLESFPHPSLGAFIEAVGVGGAFPVPAYSAEENILNTDLDQFGGMVPRSRSPEEWVGAVCDALADLSETRARGYALAMKLTRSEEEFAAALPKLYSGALSAGHRPKSIEVGVSLWTRDARILAAQSHAGLEAFDVIPNPFVRLAMKRLAKEAGIRGAAPTLLRELGNSVQEMRNYLARVWRFQVLARARAWKRRVLGALS